MVALLLTLTILTQMLIACGKRNNPAKDRGRHGNFVVGNANSIMYPRVPFSPS